MVHVGYVTEDDIRVRMGREGGRKGAVIIIALKLRGEGMPATRQSSIAFALSLSISSTPHPSHLLPLTPPHRCVLHNNTEL